MTNFIKRFNAGGAVVYEMEHTVFIIIRTIICKLKDLKVNWPDDTVIFDFPLGHGNGNLQLMTHVLHESPDVRSITEDRICLYFPESDLKFFWGRFDIGRTPLALTEAVFHRLEDIIKSVDTLYPEAGIRKHFEEIAAYAPKETPVS